jgi:hypothetical protein
LALISALVLAASAQADPPVGGGAQEASEVQDTGSESQPGPPAEGGPAASEGTVGAGGVEAPQGEVPSEPITEAPPVELPVEAEVPASEPPAETLPVTPPSEAEPITEAPPAPPPSETTEGAPVGVQSEEAPPEEPAQGKAGTTGEASEEAGPGGAARSSTAPTDETTAQDATDRAALLVEPSTSAQGPPATIAAQAAEASSTETRKDAAKRGLTAAKQAGRFSCELSALSGSMTDNCTVGWLGASHDPDRMSAGAVMAAVSSLVAVAGVSSPPGGDHGGFVASEPPVTPTPGPAPGGAAGGGATGGAAGGGVPLFLTLAGLLLLGAPRAMRRLRLSCEPWLAGCFVLIPERPD